MKVSCSAEVGKGTEDKAAGSVQLDKRNALGDGIVFYPSLRPAVTVCKLPEGQLITAFLDASGGKVVAAFDHQGNGSVCYQSGSPWVVITSQGWTIHDERGARTAHGSWPTAPAVPVKCLVTDAVRVVFVDQQRICLTLTIEDRAKELEFQCGKQSRRTDSHLDKVVATKGGKLQLDVDRIRARQAAEGSAYVLPRMQPPPPRVGRGSQHRWTGDSPLAATMQQLQASDARLQQIHALSQPVYGTARTPGQANQGSCPPPSASSADRQATPQPQPQRSSSSSRATWSAPTPPMLPDYGSPPLTASLRRLQHRCNTAVDPERCRFVARRTQLPSLRMAAVEREVAGPQAPPGCLVCVACLADWNPVCGKLEPHFQQGWWQLQSDSKDAPQGPAARIRVYRVDVSEGHELKQRYGVCGVPMFLMFFNGRLVSATNAIRSGKELHAACLAALDKGLRAQFLPDTFRCSTASNDLLDCIKPGMSLRGR